jgi:hypothetical protein
MELLPTGQKSSHAIFMYSLCVLTFSFHFQFFIHHQKKVHFYFMIVVVQVSLGTFLLRYLPGLLHLILMEMGKSEDMHYPASIPVLEKIMVLLCFCKLVNI